MSKKTFMAAIIISALLISLAAGTENVEVTKANPNLFNPPPQTPNKDPPILTIQSPINTTYNVNYVWLNLTVTQPDSWPKVWPASCITTNVTYQIDGQEINLWNGYDGYTPTMQFSTVLSGIVEGQHILQTNVYAVSEYTLDPIQNSSQGSYHILDYPLNTSQTILFSVNANPPPSPSPSPSASPTSTLSPSASPILSASPSSSVKPTQSPTPGSTPTSPTEYIIVTAATVAIIAIVAASILRKRANKKQDKIQMFTV